MLNGMRRRPIGLCRDKGWGAEEGQGVRGVEPPTSRSEAATREGEWLISAGPEGGRGMRCLGHFDWHSSVHGHWALVRLLRLYPEHARME